MSRPLLIMHEECYDAYWDRLDEGLHHFGAIRGVSLWALKLIEKKAFNLKHALCVCSDRRSWRLWLASGIPWFLDSLALKCKLYRKAVMILRIIIPDLLSETID